jgi:methyl-accepting chemotaxis protein
MTVQRWNDEMLDDLASSVTELRESITQVRESITEVKDSIDGLRVTAQALLQVATQNQREMELIKQRQAESDQRFNILLEEVRSLRASCNITLHSSKVSPSVITSCHSISCPI